MRCSEAGLALLREFEGFSGRVYVCAGGKKTIGFGHVIRAGEVFAAGGIDVGWAELLLKQDVGVAERAVFRLVDRALTQGQFDGLVCFVYNVGVYAFEKSSLLRFVRAGDVEGAAGQFGRWIYAGGKGLKGLVRRREAEKMLFLA